MEFVDIKVSTHPDTVTVEYKRWEGVLPDGETMFEVMGGTIPGGGSVRFTEEEVLEIEATLEAIL